jgi:DNA modification methylase
VIDLVAYRRFIDRKVPVAQRVGFDVAADEIHPYVSPHARAMVQWAVRGGRRAIFAAFGLHKTVIQLETVRLIRKRVGGRALIVLPLGVRQEFVRDASLLALAPRFIRDTADAERTAAHSDGIYLTNYESVREGKIDPSAFSVVSMDEADVLRSFGSKTFGQVVITGGWDQVPYRFVATATPDPNDYLELLGYAQFLGIMEIGAAKTRFFKRDSEHADRLTLHSHKVDEFWRWVATWALIVQRPSDLGFSDEGYALPPLDVRWHELPSDHAAAGAEKSGQRRLLRRSAAGVSEASREKRDSLPLRLAKLMELRAEDPGAHRLLWHDLEAERKALERALPRAEFGGEWQEYQDGNQVALALYERHYSAHRYADGRERKLFCGPGEKTVLLTRDQRALFVWRKFVDDSGQQGINCAVFRNEGTVQSSELILEAMAIAWLRWPGERFYTYVDAAEVRSENPGYCFLCAGWQRAGVTKGGLLILEALPGVAVPAVARREVMRTIYGTQPLDEREALVRAFADGEVPELAGKPVMLGAGCNLQRHCAWAIFMGIGFKFRDLIQAIHRLHRFLQPHQVRIDLIYTEAERGVREQLEAKWRRHEQQTARMSELIREQGLTQLSMAAPAVHAAPERQAVEAEGYRLVLGDCVEETAAMPADSVGLVLTSPPFSSQYRYSSDLRDFGHTDGAEDFWRQMDFLTPELLRVLQPGRDLVVHLKDRVQPGEMNGWGFQTVDPFHCQAIEHYRRHGFALLGYAVVVTDVVRENNQTYRLGWTEQCKDGSRMGAGLPEWLLIFRKPPTDSADGYADVPVVKAKADYPRARWQLDAHAYWRSSGDRLLVPEDLAGQPWRTIYRTFRAHSTTHVYDHEHHVACGAALEAEGQLPPDFMLLPPVSWHPDVWSDVTRMRTLNAAQANQGRVKHLCPLQFDIVERVIRQRSMPGETVFDPFGGLFTVPYMAVKLGRRGEACELSPSYFADGVRHVEAAAAAARLPTLFDLLGAEEVAGEPEEAGAEPLAACNGHSEEAEAVIGELYEPAAVGRLQEEA